jgi:RimJ/RimL family protein N-acetyltransferase
MPEFYTRRLHLRLPTLADSPALAGLMTPTISARLASWPPVLDEAAAGARIAQSLIDFQSGQAMPLVVCRREDGAVLGWIGARRHAQAHRLAVLTYWVGEAHRGLGLMREAAPAALAHSFTCLGVDHVHAAVQSDNLQSRAVLRALGMRMIELGRIWCDARDRHEACEWWGLDRPGLALRDAPPATLPAYPPVAGLAAAG